MNEITQFDWTQAFGQMSGSWGQWMLVSFVESILLLVIVGMLWAVIRNRVAPQVGVWLFLLVPIKLLIPFTLPAPQKIADLSPMGWVRSTLDSSVESLRSPPVADDKNEFEAIQIGNAKQTELPPFSNAEALSLPILPPNLIENDIAIDSIPDVSSVNSQTLPSLQPNCMDRPLQRATQKSFVTFSIVFVVWSIITAFLMLRFLISQLRFNQNVRSNSTAIELSSLPFDWEPDCQQLGLRRTVRLRESNHVSAPIVCGLIDPTIVVPAQFGDAVTVEQFRWAVLHELAHIKRHDLWFVLLQRIAVIWNWFNPAVWLANYWVDQLREFACDDLASVAAEAEPAESGQAFLEILKFTSAQQPQTANALGIFGWNCRAKSNTLEVAGRLKRIIDDGRNIMITPGKWSIIGLFIVALLVLPKLHVAGNPTLENNETSVAKSSNEDDATIESTGKFELFVVDKDNNPVSEADVQIRMNPQLEDEKQVLVGQFVRKHRYGTDFKTDQNGRLSISMEEQPASMDLFVQTSGYGPFYSPWKTTNSSVGIPARQKIVLDSAWTIGGIIENEKGEPVSGAEIRVSLRFKSRPDFDSRLHVGTKITTDKHGIWRYDQVPDWEGQLSIELKHDDYMTSGVSLSRSDYEVAPGRELNKTKMVSGLKLAGSITDENGDPIEGALVRTKFLNQKRETRTDADGTYQMNGCRPGKARVVVSAPSKAFDLKDVFIADDMGAANFQMNPGGKVRVKVLDSEGKPLPNASFLIQSWRGKVNYFEFDDVNCKTNDAGIWEWNEAPTDSFVGDIFYRGDRGEFMTLSDQTIKIGEKVQVFTLPRQLYVSGQVTDAETGEPIGKFRVIPGLEHKRRNLATHEGFDAKDGKYRLKHFRQSYKSHFVRIEADGYMAVESRNIKPDEGEVVVDFKLKRGTNIAATVLTPDGKPAAGASVTVGLSGSQISIENGRIDKSSTCQSPTVASDESGQFKIPPRQQGYHLVILHETGFAHVITGMRAQTSLFPESNSQRFGELPAEIRLTAWGRIEGTLKSGAQIQANQNVTLLGGGIHSYGEGVPNIFTHNDVVSGAGGKFVFERVTPGNQTVARRITLTVNNGATAVASAREQPTIVRAGETTKLAVGGSGRAVIGKLNPAPDFADKPLWNFAEIQVERNFVGRDFDMPKLDPPAAVQGDAEKYQAWFKAWNETPDGKKYNLLLEQQKRSPRFFATVDKDGTFRIDDIPAGKYRLRVDFYQHAAGGLSGYQFEIVDDSISEPLDLKTITLLPATQ